MGESLRANFMVLESRAWTAFAHTAAVSEDIVRISSPCFGSCCTWESCCLAPIIDFPFGSQGQGFPIEELHLTSRSMT